MESGQRDRPVGAVGDACATAAAYAVAGAIHLVTAGLFIGGLTMIVLGFHTIIQPLLGLIPLGLALALRPRLGRLDPRLPVLREADAPALFELLHRTADSAGARRIEAIQLTPDFSVSVIHCGVRRSRCLVLGLPLWAAYSPQQRIAAVIQALGESVPRNLRCGVFVGSALRSVTAAAQSMRANNAPGVTPGAHSHFLHAAEVAAAAAHLNARSRRGEWVLWLPRVAAAATARLLLRLTRPSARRARFEADDAAARAASSQAALAALRDRGLARATGLEMHRLAVEKRTVIKARTSETPGDDLWESVGRHAERLREQRETSRTPGLVPEPRNGTSDSTTAGSPASAGSDALRITRLADAPQCPATLTLDAPGRAMIEGELRPAKRAVEQLVLREGMPLAG